MDWGQKGGTAGSPTPVNPCGDPFPGGGQGHGRGRHAPVAGHPDDG